MDLNRYLKKQKSIDPIDLRKTSLVFNLLSGLTGYTSLMLGIYGVSREDPKFSYVLLGGIGYLVSKFLDSSGNFFGLRAEGEIINQKEEEIIQRLGLLERKVSGRAIGASILDPNEKLDDMLHNREKEGKAIVKEGENILRILKRVERPKFPSISEREKTELKELEDEIKRKKPDNRDTNKIDKK